MASTYLSKTYGSSGNRQRQTISVWVKRTKFDDTQTIFWSNGGASHYAHLRFKSDNTLQYYANNVCNLKTKYAFLDPNAWYHIVVTLDTTQATEADRLKIYVNGVQQTVFLTSSYPSQNAEVKFADDNIHYIGQSDSGSYFEGLMSHFHFVTNTAYQASTFGSTDAATGEWNINTSPTVTYNTNSFFVFKDGNSGTDQSGQGNNYSVANGTLTKTEDCPSNNFSTLNPLVPSGGGYQGNSSVFSKGNTTFATNNSSSNYGLCLSSIGVNSGKWYIEARFDTKGNEDLFGISAQNITSTANYLGGGAYSYGFYQNGTYYHNGSGSSYGGNSWSVNDILRLAVDLDNNKLYFGLNGTWQNSSDPTSGSTGTGAVSITDPSSTDTGHYFIGYGNASNSSNGAVSFNFGNGYFGTTAVSSAGTNASNNGIFEYDVPTGYTALSTKGLNL